MMRLSICFHHIFCLCVLSILICLPAGILAETSGVQMRTMFRLEGSKDISFRQPTDVAVGRAGNIYVMDGLNSRVAAFDSKGEHLLSFGSRGSRPGEFLRPVGIDASTDGTVIVADTGNHRIQVFSPGGTFLRAFPLTTGQNGAPTDVCVSEPSNIYYVCDNDNHQVQAYTFEGQLLRILGGRGKALGEFRYPATPCLSVFVSGRAWSVDVPMCGLCVLLKTALH